MLIEFRVENHRSIRDEQVLTMEAGHIGADDDPRPRAVAGYSEKILPVAAIYGANASGKSNVLAALAFMKEAVLSSSRLWSPDEGIPRDPFAWGQKRDEPSTYEVEVLIDRTRYRYGFRLNERVFLEEWLFAWPNGRKQVWLERDGEKFKFGEHMRGENKVIEEVTRPNALFLSAAALLKHPQLSTLYSWFASVETINLLSRRLRLTVDWSELGMALFLDKSNAASLRKLLGDEEIWDWMLNRFRSLLKNADTGIVDLRLNLTEPVAGSTFQASPIELKHQNETADAWLPLTEESNGTKTLFRLALPVLMAIRSGKVLLVDELESSLHPNLAEQIVRMFNDTNVNTRNAQLIFSTHDTNLLGTLMGEPALRRDQVWLTEKDAKGATVLYPLTDFKPRKDENIERGYIQGRYGAVPFLGGFGIPVE